MLTSIFYFADFPGSALCGEDMAYMIDIYTVCGALLQPYTSNQLRIKRCTMIIFIKTFYSSKMILVC